MIFHVSFNLISYFATKRVAKSLKFYHELPEKHQRVYLEEFEDNCKELLRCIDENKQIIDLILEDVDSMFENVDRDSVIFFSSFLFYLAKNECLQKKIKDISKNARLDLDKPRLSMVQDVDRVITTLKQIVRDWSIEGLEERKLCYGLILDELKKLFPNVKPNNEYYS
jgi:carnosine N-methyltransferase